MADFFHKPRATCRVIQRPPGELEPWTTHMVSMMRAIQSGARLTVLSRGFCTLESRLRRLTVNGGGKVDHMGGSIVGLRLSMVSINVRLNWSA